MKHLSPFRAERGPGRPAGSFGFRGGDPGLAGIDQPSGIAASSSPLLATASAHDAGRGTAARKRFRLAVIAIPFCLQWLALQTQAQTPPAGPLSLDQNAFLYRTFSVYRTNTAPLINWQSKRGVPISTNASDLGSDGRAPTLAQQINYGPNFATAWPATTNQFIGMVAIGAVPVGAYANLNTNLSFSANATNLDWPRVA